MVPGVAHGVLGRPWVTYRWLAAVIAAMIASAFWVWALACVIAIPLAAAVVAFRTARAANRAGIRSLWGNAALALALYITLSAGVRVFVYEAYLVPTTSMSPTLMLGDHIQSEKLTLRWRPPERGELVVFTHPCDPEREYLKRVIAIAGDTVEIRCDLVYVNGKPLPSVFSEGTCTYDDSDEHTGRWDRRACTEYTETHGARSYRVYHNVYRPKRASSESARDFPSTTDHDATAPSCLEDTGSPAQDQQPGVIVWTKRDAPACEQQVHYVVPAAHVFVLGDNRPNSNDSRYWGSVPVSTVRARITAIYWSSSSRRASLSRFGPVH